MSGTPPAAIDWERLGYQSGRAQAERDGAYYDALWGYVVNGEDDAAQMQARITTLAPHVILSMQPDRPQDAQFQADCQRLAEGFAQGYFEALI
jgi:hypothetical protein